MVSRILLLILAFLANCPLNAQTLRFYAQPWRVSEGDAVTLVYLEKAGSLPRSEIGAWEWDFDGDGVYDASGVAPEDGSVPVVNGVWYATYDRNRASGGEYRVRPRLKVTTRTGETLRADDGVTEDVNGLVTGDAKTDLDPEVVVVEGQAGNGEVKVTFGPSQRMVVDGTKVRFFSQVEFLRPGRVVGLDWNFSGKTNFGAGSDVVLNTPSPERLFPLATGATNGSFSVAMRVRYQIRTTETDYSEERAVVRVLPDCVRVLATADGVLPVVQLGRAYRRGFPEQYDWNDILQAYTARSADGDDRVYYHLFEKALLNLDRPEALSPAQRQLAAEIVNELLQGQLLVGNQRLIEALRIKYPRLTNPNDEEQRLPAPPGVRSETAAIEVALLDFQAALFHVCSRSSRKKALKSSGPRPSPERSRSRIFPGTSPSRIPAFRPRSRSRSRTNGGN